MTVVLTAKIVPPNNNNNNYVNKTMLTKVIRRRSKIAAKILPSQIKLKSTLCCTWLRFCLSVSDLLHTNTNYTCRYKER